MLRPIKQLRSSILGVDVRFETVRIVELSREGDLTSVHSIGYSTIPSHVFSDHVIRDTDFLVATIKQLRIQSDFISHKAVIALPDSLVEMRILHLRSNLCLKDLEALLALESEKIFARSSRLICFDFMVLEKTKHHEWQKILLIATPIENVQTRVQLLEAAGLTVFVADVESFAIERILQHAHSLINPFLGMQGCEQLKSNSIDNNVSSFMLSCGLGLRGLQ